jgi:ribosomal-protein-alanine N-acetyltransferase
VDTLAALSLRPARPDELPALVALDRTCFGARAWSAHAWWEAVLDPAFATLVVARDEELLGAVVVLPHPPVASLASLAVDPRHRRLGVGRRMLMAAFVMARAAAARWLSLEVDADNAPAVRLYSGEGFGLRRRFREDGRWRLEMCRRLGGRRG